MQYDVLEENINIEFQSPYNDPGIHVQNDEDSQPYHPHHVQHEEENEEEEEGHYNNEI